MIAIKEETQITFRDIKLITVSPFEANSDFSEINRRLAGGSLDAVLQWSLPAFGDKVALVTSFGPTGMVILDRLAKLSPGLKVITLDTDFLFAETYALREQVQRCYPIQLEIRKSGLTPGAQAEAYGPELWQTNPDLCCHLRKVAPLAEALAGLEAWLTGLRRDQASTRTAVPLVAWDNKYDLLKINPLAAWTRPQVWAYLLENKVPYNRLHDQGYASIGCTHCTWPTNHPADERAGRWQGSKTECGIHLQ
jgi:phosphoadenosine phosphosulfate reductase